LNAAINIKTAGLAVSGAIYQPENVAAWVVACLRIAVKLDPY
jgi:hypothetical protein